MITINLIDVSGFVYRAFYALPSLTFFGKELGAVYGFCAAMLKITSQFPNSMFIAAFDSSRKTFRNEIYEFYKANRKETPQELIDQIPTIKVACEKFGFLNVEESGFEADDIIASYVHLLKGKGYNINIVSSDKDLMQLLSIEGVTIFDPIKKKYIEEKDVMNKFGVSSSNVLDILSLTGDSSDNIPGVPGIGPKTAANLINEFGSLDGLIANLDKLPNNKRNTTLREEIEKARMSRELATLRCDIPVDFEYKETHTNSLKEFFEELGFQSLANRRQSVETNLTPVMPPLEPSIEQSLLKSVNQKIFKKSILRNDIDDVKYEIFIDEEISQAYWKSVDDSNVSNFTLEKIKNILEDKDILKVCVNSKKFIKSCWELDIDTKNTVDLSVMSYCISGTKTKHDLKSQEMEYIGGECEYPAETVCKLYELLKIKLNQETQRLFEMENKITVILAKMEHTGILVDIPYLYELNNYFQDKINELTIKIHNIAGVGFNIASPKQVSYILFEKLGLQVVDKKRSTDAAALANFSGMHDGITDKILLWREYSKLQNTYIKSLLKSVDVNNRVHTTYLQTVVNTGRLSSIEPNLQNIPARSEEGRKIRRAFIAPSGKKLVSFDYSQMELRLLAHLSKSKKLTEAFRSGQDIHVATASNIFNTPHNEVTKDQRRAAKEINFSIIYGMSIHHLSEKLGISRKEAEIIYHGFFDLYPEVLRYMKSLEDFAIKNEYVTTILGRMCFVPLINSKNKNMINFAKRQATNAPIQGSSADIIKLAMVEIDEYISNNSSGITMLLQVHDELVFEVLDEEIEKCVEVVKDLMENAVKLDVPLVVDVKIDKHLG